jgi:hypothetical protein
MHVVTGYAPVTPSKIRVYARHALIFILRLNHEKNDKRTLQVYQHRKRLSSCLDSGSFDVQTLRSVDRDRVSIKRPFPSPHLRCRAKDLPVFASLTTRRPSAFRSWLTSSGVASNRGPARRQVLDFPRPFLGWILRVACPQGEPRTATGRPTLPAPLPVVRLGPKPSSSPSGGDRPLASPELNISKLPRPTSLPAGILSCSSRVSRRLPNSLASYWFDAPVLRFGRFTVFG